MFKYNEKYLLSIGNKDKGSVKIYGIVNKDNANLKKRLHKVKVRLKIVNFFNN